MKIIPKVKEFFIKWLESIPAMLLSCLSLAASVIAFALAILVAVLRH